MDWLDPSRAGLQGSGKPLTTRLPHAGGGDGLILPRVSESPESVSRPSRPSLRISWGRLGRDCSGWSDEQQSLLSRVPMLFAVVHPLIAQARRRASHVTSTTYRKFMCAMQPSPPTHDHQFCLNAVSNGEQAFCAEQASAGAGQSLRACERLDQRPSVGSTPFLRHY